MILEKKSKNIYLMIRNKVETRKNIARISDKVGAYTVEDSVPKVKLRKNVGFFWGGGGGG